MRFDAKKMRFLFEYVGDSSDNPDIFEKTIVVSVPAKIVVCDTCHGTGCSDPEAFSDGFTGSEFAEMCAEDDDFASNYFGGKYDVQCRQCAGEKVVPVVDYDNLTAEQIKWVDYNNRLEQDYAYEENMRRRGIQF
jgi:hypothetical protein